MAATLKPLSEQVMVITGASSGIGLATARRAAAAGARVVLAARNSEALDEAVVSELAALPPGRAWVRTNKGGGTIVRTLGWFADPPLAAWINEGLDEMKEAG